MKPSLTTPQATVLAAVITLSGVLLGHILTYVSKERDRQKAN
jgi:hypothetical protein